MILKGSQRGGASSLAAHLLNAKDNEHIEVAAINGFIADTVEGAFQEVHAASLATSCKQFLFSLSLSPPEEAVVSNQDFCDAIDQAINCLGLAGQPSVVIYHEKNGRRHAHLVVSRIDGEKLKSINLPFYKERLCELSRELYLAHNWQLPKGHLDRVLGDPLSYSLEEHQVAKRVKRDPKELKWLLRDCWEKSDSKAGFMAALNEAGFQLCRGDQRAFVAVDSEGNVYSLSRWLGVKTKQIMLRLGNPDELPVIEETVSAFQQNPAYPDIESVSAKPDPRIIDLDKRIDALGEKKADLIGAHRSERKVLIQSHKDQRVWQIREFKQSRSSLGEFWSWVTGKRQAVIAERQAVFDTLKEKQELEALKLSNSQRIAMRRLRAEIAEFTKQRDALAPRQKPAHVSQPVLQSADPTADPNALFHTQQIRKQPDHVLRIITDRKANFSRGDIIRTLARYLDDPLELRELLEQVLQSPELLKVEGGSKTNPRFTTHTFHKLQTKLFSLSGKMANRKAYGVQPKHMAAAINRQNVALQKSTGARLSNEQCAAIEHVLNRRQFSALVGLAGAGKSTLLSAANEAWTAQGYRVVGAALSGKAADGLQSASNIPSRTLSSWEMSWKHGYHHLQAGDVLVIDEAGMVGSAQLSRFVKEAHIRKAKLVLVGDPDQLQPINAGTPFREIANKTGFAELSQIHRQKDNWQKRASLDLARGRIEEAIKAYDDHGAIEFAQTTDDAIAALAEDYMVDYELNGESKSRIALAHRRKDVHAINEVIRAARKSAGELADEIIYQTDTGPRAFATGDRLLFTRNDHQLGVRNGMLGTIDTTHKGELVVRIDYSNAQKSTRNITINPNRYNSFDHGYATTIHKSQGATLDNAYILASRTLDRNLTYVAMTRHRHNARLYAAREEFTNFDNLARGLARNSHNPVNIIATANQIPQQNPLTDSHDQLPKRWRNTLNQSSPQTRYEASPELELEL